MANNNRKYKGSLRLDWINKDLSLYYEIDEKEGKGVRPVWVPKNDIRVAEPRILKFVKSYGDPTSENLLIKGDNLLVLRSLVEMFKGKPEKNRVKCVYIDPPFNTGNAFKYYDDNLQHSEWLTMMRDRLQLLRKLMRKDGVIFVHIDDEEMAYLKVLMDEIFGRDNFITSLVIKMSHLSGVKMSHIRKKPPKIKEFILLYAKEKGRIELEPLYEKASWWDVFERYTLYLIKDKNDPDNIAKWKVRPLKKVAEENGVDISNDEEFASFCIKNAHNIFRTARNRSEQFLNLPRDEKFRQIITPSGLKKIAYKREEVLFAHEKLQNGEVRSVLGDIWLNIGINNLHKEGGVSLRFGKKPERLLFNILKLCTKEGDLVLDYFAGSGTTGAVAHKMGRRWIMVEIGRQAEKLIIPRMQRVISGKDQTGISKEVNWKGGGGFKYYKLGESVIYEKDMNWKLKAKEMAEAIFLHFQYKPVKVEWLEKYNMYLGKHRSARYHFALSYATRKTTVIDEEMYETIIKRLEKEKNFRHLTIFTNVAVAIPPESMDERVLVKKIPAAILREYNLL